MRKIKTGALVLLAILACLYIAVKIKDCTDRDLTYDIFFDMCKDRK